jgi:hypothetical protein
MLEITKKLTKINYLFAYETKVESNLKPTGNFRSVFYQIELFHY